MRVRSFTALALVCILLSSCSSPAQTTPLAEFVQGEWLCKVIGGSGSNSNLEVTFTVTDSHIVVGQGEDGEIGMEGTYDYELTENGLKTYAGSDGGWDISAPSSIAENRDFSADVAGWGHSSTVESPKLTFTDGGIKVDSFYQYVFQCARQ